ncbi:MAG: DUF4397 domain-containing protein [Deltaproteobacteria bacterium]|nr:DUF4397 domain-containing protein [Deltaproteobacteria bacterium]
MSKSKFILAGIFMVALIAFMSGCTEDKKYYPFLGSDGAGAEEIIQELYSKVRVIHADYLLGAVDIDIDDGEASLTALGYGETSGYVPLEPGYRNLKVTPSGQAMEIKIEGNIELFLNFDYTALAIPVVENGLIFRADFRAGPTLSNDEDVQILLLPDARYSVEGMAKIRFIHASPDTPDVDVGYFDRSAGALVKVFEDVSFSCAEEYVLAPPDTYTFAVTVAGFDDPVLLFEPVSLADGGVYTIIAHGSFSPDDEYPLRVTVFVDNLSGDEAFDLVQATLPEIRAIHTSTRAFEIPVDVAVDDGFDEPAFEDVAYGDSSGYGTLFPGTRNLKVVPADQEQPVVIEADLPLEVNDDYTIFAMDDPESEAGLIPVALYDDRAAVNDQVKLRFVHASPDAPAVDVGLWDGETFTPVFSNVAYTEFSDYVQVDPGEYTFGVAVAGQPTPLLVYQSVDLDGGSVLTATAFGTVLDELDPGVDDDDFPFTVGVFVDNDPGDTFIELTPQEAGE